MMNDKQESALGLIAALLVLFSAMIAPPASAMLAVLMLIAFAVYKFWQSRQTTNWTQEEFSHDCACRSSL
jgi:hypothetical protein